MDEKLIVRVVRKKGLRQQFHTVLESSNGQILLTSENYRHRSYAVGFGKGLAMRLDAAFKDDTL